MKLKIRGNLLRIRLSRAEVDTFDATGKVEASIQHGRTPAESLRYSIERGAYSDIQTSYGPNQLRIFVPDELARRWVNSPLTNIEQPASPHAMHIRMEKDYQCLRGQEMGSGRDEHPPGTLRQIR